MLARLILPLAVLAGMLPAGAPAGAIERYWIEPGFESFPPKGPEAALGIVIWNHGLKGHESQYQYPPPPLVQGLAARGWDVIKLNRDPTWENSWSNAGKRHVERLIEEVAAVRAKGYRRVIVAGQSYGGAISLAAAGELDGLWAVIATAPGTGQATMQGEITDKWSDAIARDTYDELRRLRHARVVLVLPKDDELITIARGPTARTILQSKAELPFLLVDETVPLKGHSAAYSADFNPYASCIGYFLEPESEPRAGEFHCLHDEFARVKRIIQLADAKALATAGATWFGYYPRSGQELVLTLGSGGGTGEVVEYAWGPGTLAKFKPGAVTAPLEHDGEKLVAHLGKAAVISATKGSDGMLYATFTKDGQAQLMATLSPVER
jgi:pimeloyl-ACP methyl ester carboxylesterase